MNRSIKMFLSLFCFILIVNLLNSCTTVENPSPDLDYVDIPDVNFEKALIQFKIDLHFF